MLVTAHKDLGAHKVEGVQQAWPPPADSRRHITPCSNHRPGLNGANELALWSFAPHQHIWLDSEYSITHCITVIQ